MITRINLYLTAFICAFLLISCGQQQNNDDNNAMTDIQIPEYALVVHGGAGTIKRSLMKPEKETAYRSAIDTALQIGSDILKGGGSSMDAVEQTVRYLEDCPLFNAGRGSVFTNDGKNEMDASIMDGSTLNAGAVCGVRLIKHPISAARKVLSHSNHVMLSGQGAESFAQENGLSLVDPAYFHTERRWESLQRALKKEQEKASKKTGYIPGIDEDYKYGTVGAVALDKNGNIAAATSTGGMTNKRFNRVGDSPIIGAGTYADNASAGVSCTGHGEFFIRYAVAHDLCAMVQYTGRPLAECADEIIMRKLKNAGGDGGLIALNRQGQITMPFNTSGMYRGYIRPDTAVIKIYDDE